MAKLRPVKNRLLEIPDAQAVGLYLLIYPSSKKVWALRYRRPKDRRPAKLTLGTVFADQRKTEPDIVPVIGDHMTLAGARRLVAELKHEIALGQRPRCRPHRQEAYRRLPADATSERQPRTSSTEYARKHTRRWEGDGSNPSDSSRPLDGSLDIIAGGLTDRWWAPPLAEIDEDAIFRVVDEARRKGVPGLGRRNQGSVGVGGLAQFTRLSPSCSAGSRRSEEIKVNPMVALTSPSAAEGSRPRPDQSARS